MMNNERRSKLSQPMNNNNSSNKNKKEHNRSTTPTKAIKSWQSLQAKQFTASAELEPKIWASKQRKTPNIRDQPFTGGMTNTKSKNFKAVS